jgi:UrcA family protein
MFSKQLRLGFAGRWLAPLCFAVVASTTQSAHAQIDPPHERVRVNDLDLATDAGRQRLDTRIRSAAIRVCQKANPGYGLAPRTRCINIAVASAAVARTKAINRALDRVAVAPQTQEALGVAAYRANILPLTPPAGYAPSPFQ